MAVIELSGTETLIVLPFALSKSKLLFLSLSLSLSTSSSPFFNKKVY